MNVSILRRAALFCLFSSASLAAPVVQVDGRFSVVRDGVFDVILEVRDDDGAVRLTTTELGVIVVDGVFGIDVDVATIAADLEAGDVMTIDVEIDDLIATARLGPAFSAADAQRAASASTVVSAARLGSTEPASLIQVSTLDDVGAVQIAFGNLTDVPAGIADGVDSGDIDTVGAGLVVTGGTLRLAPSSVTTAMLVDASVAAAALADLTMTTRELAGLGNSDVGDASLTGAEFADGSFVAANVASSYATTALLTIVNSACTPVGSDGFTNSQKCVRRTCGTDGRVVCSDRFEECEDPFTGSTSALLCDNTDVGFVLFPPPPT